MKSDYFNQMIEDYHLYFSEKFGTNSYLDNSLDLKDFSFQDVRRICTLVHLIESGNPKAKEMIPVLTTKIAWEEVKNKLNVKVDEIIGRDLVLFNYLLNKHKLPREDNRYTLLSYAFSKGTFLVDALRNITVLRYLDGTSAERVKWDKITNGYWFERILITDILMNNFITDIPKIKGKDVIKEAENINEFIDIFFNQPTSFAYSYIKNEVIYFFDRYLTNGGKCFENI